jgi:dipeptidyl aminopeptidase/acylaminoacyl peptidase
MGRTTLSALVGLLAAIAGSALHASSLEVYGGLPGLEDVAISPEGTRLAFVKTEGENRFVEAYSLSDRKVIAAARVGDTKLRRIQWADEDHLLIFTSTTAVPLGLMSELHEWVGLQVWDVKAHRLRAIPGQNPFSGINLMNVVWGETMIRHVQGHTILFVPVIVVEGRTVPALERVDLTGAGEKLVREGASATQEWLVDAAGEISAEQDYDEASRHWAIKLRRDGRMQEVTGGTEPIDVPRMLGFGPVDDTILMQAYEQNEPVWRLLSLKDGSLGAPMAERRSLESPIEASNGDRMIGGMRLEDDAHYVFFDPGMQLRWDTIADHFPGEHLRLVSLDSDLLRFVVRVDGPAHGYQYYLADMQTRQIRTIGEVYQGAIRPYEVKRITYPAADGMNIPAYLTLPKDRAPEKLPLIVLPHGGPQARDSADFDWWSQALADQGYAVLRPNFRGSTVSRRFIAAGYGQWGRKMQTDLSDGVRYLVKQGIVDAMRVCIVGASYGGYAALAGATLDTGVYRCAVSVAGVSDLSRQLEWVARNSRGGQQTSDRYWDRFMGVTGPDDRTLDAISPIKHVDAITVPVLLIHGKDDTVVPYEQSQGMYDALRRANKPVEMVTLKHEDHWLSRAETRLQMLQACVAFLRAHNPPD